MCSCMKSRDKALQFGDPKLANSGWCIYHAACATQGGALHHLFTASRISLSSSIKDGPRRHVYPCTSLQVRTIQKVFCGQLPHYWCLISCPHIAETGSCVCCLDRLRHLYPCLGPCSTTSCSISFSTTSPLASSCFHHHTLKSPASFLVVFQQKLYTTENME